MQTSTPNVSSFKPLDQQREILRDIRKKFDYTKGVHELMLSGSVGSAKSLTLAHIAVTHCLLFPNARFGIGRLALPQLKQTLCLKIREHLFGVGVDYRYNETTGSFRFPNGSTIPALSWSDGNLAKLGSYEFSGFGIEELPETNSPGPYNTLKQRVGRLPHIPEQILISATNPDSPSHWAYKRIIEKSEENDLINVYYSNTFDNPYLPPTYTQNLLETLDERMAQRMVYGKWVEITSDILYYAYDKSKNFIDHEYDVVQPAPIIVSWDFNIGLGKPLSACFMQYINGNFHVFDEVVVEGQRTLDSLEEMSARGLFDYDCEYIIHGDATGRHKDTRSKRSDWDIIDGYLSNLLSSRNRAVRYRIDVPRSNPPIRTRHNVMNGQICNARGERRLFVYKGAKTVDEGLRLTKLRSGAQYLEDDSDSFQHITTALGYAVCGVLSKERNKTGVVSFKR